MINYLKHFSILFIITLSFSSCKKECTCEFVIYESTFETSYEWIETNRESTSECKTDTMSSTFLDDNNNISYIRSIIECINIDSKN